MPVVCDYKKSPQNILRAGNNRTWYPYSLIAA